MSLPIATPLWWGYDGPIEWATSLGNYSMVDGFNPSYKIQPVAESSRKKAKKIERVKAQPAEIRPMDSSGRMVLRLSKTYCSPKDVEKRKDPSDGEWLTEDQMLMKHMVGPCFDRGERFWKIAGAFEDDDDDTPPPLLEADFDDDTPSAELDN